MAALIACSKFDCTAPRRGTSTAFPGRLVAGDVQAWGDVAADDVVIHMRGKPAINGDYGGHQGVLEMFGRLAALKLNNVQADVEDVWADDRYAGAILRVTYRRGAQASVLRNACAYKLSPEGKVQGRNVIHFAAGGCGCRCASDHAR